MTEEEGLSHGPSSQGAKTSALSTQLNIMNTVMGVAILSLPSVFYTTGILIGVVMLIIFAFFHYWTCQYLCKVKNIHDHSNYTTIGRASLGNWVVPIVKAVMIFNAIGVCQLYLIIFHDVFETVFVEIIGFNPEYGVGWFFRVKYFIIPLTALCLLPFAFKRSTDGLKIASYISVSASVIFIIAMALAFGLKCHHGTINWDQVGWFWTKNGGNITSVNDYSVGNWGTSCVCPNGESYMVGSIKTDSLPADNCVNFGCFKGTTSGECLKEAGIWSKTKVTCYDGNTNGMALIQIASHLPQIVMAFTFQFNFFSFYKSLDIKPHENADHKMLKISFRSIMSVCIIYLITAILGYISFGNITQGKIIANINNNGSEFGTVFLTIFNLAFMCLSG